ncbi:sulfatase-like hydrolase/transferase [Paenibacillus sp. GYB004]|uniref:sulfatase/phosphatase domain-containing protein n=1 Tax=Paenibacillus sp. GYB004 TaxID=2994393 RepID=UPI002F966C77
MNSNLARVMEKQKEPVTVVIVGAGHRSLLYASFAQKHPDQMKIVGVVEPDNERRKLTMERFGIREDNCFAELESFIRKPKMADAVINGTLDHIHVATSIPLLRAGYDILLEKPIGISEDEVLKLYEEACRYDRKVMICHVLRYAPFYESIRREIAEGVIGDIVSVTTSENVSYHHMAMAYVRGKWGNKDKSGSSMLMAKSCHDLDIVTWMMGDVRPVKASSFGSLRQFRPEQAPEGAGTRCMVDCPIEETCAYSARKNYIEQRLWRAYVSYNTHLGVKASDVIDELKKEDLYDNSLIIFTSDHGEMLGSHGLWQKMCMYEESVRTPLYMKFPADCKPAAISIESLVSSIDVLPTICDYMNFRPKSPMSGRSLIPLISGKSSGRERVFIQYDGNGGRGNFQRCIVEGDYKLIVDLFKDETFIELYNVIADPQEMENLAFQDRTYRMNIEEMLHRLREHMRVTNDLLELPPDIYDRFLKSYTEFKA